MALASVNRPLQFLLRDKLHCTIHELPSPINQQSLSKTIEMLDEKHAKWSIEGAVNCVYAHGGERLAVLTKNDVKILDAETLKICCRIEHVGISLATFSPKSARYLTTWQSRAALDIPENLLVWDLEGSNQPRVILRVLHKLEIQNNQWPIQWSYDEQWLALYAPDGIRFYDAETMATGNATAKNPSAWLRMPNLGSFRFSPSSPHIGVFTPTYSATPSKIEIYKAPYTAADLVATRNTFMADEAQFMWSPNGQVLLVQTSTSTDRTGQSYYGESHLHLLAINGVQCAVSFGDNNGSVQDCAWGPTGKEFVVIQGFQPSKATLFKFDGSIVVPLRDYGHASRNTIRWNPHERFMVLGGFGNLLGQMDFYDQFKFRKFATEQDSDAPKWTEWAPDGRVFVTAALRPWRTVAEGYKIWSYAGELLHSQKIPDLYQVAFRPAARGVYENVPASPRIAEMRKLQASQSSAASIPTKPAAYIPPHLRKSTTADSRVSGRDILHADVSKSGPRKIQKAEQRKHVNGQSGSMVNSVTVTASNAPSAELRATAPKHSAVSQSGMSDAEISQKLKSLNRKMKQLIEIKAKDPASLTVEQKQKVSNEAVLQAEISSLTERLRTSAI